MVDGKRVYCGSFKTPCDASFAYDFAAIPGRVKPSLSSERLFLFPGRTEK